MSDQCGPLGGVMRIEDKNGACILGRVPGLCCQRYCSSRDCPRCSDDIEGGSASPGVITWRVRPGNGGPERAGRVLVSRTVNLSE